MGSRVVNAITALLPRLMDPSLYYYFYKSDKGYGRKISEIAGAGTFEEDT